MTIAKTLVAAIVSLAATPAFAGSVTRSSAALPSVQKVAPVAQVRQASATKKNASNAWALGGTGWVFVSASVAAALAGLGFAVSYSDTAPDSPPPLTGQQ